jgi:hypothetical protein
MVIAVWHAAPMPSKIVSEESNGSFWRRQEQAHATGAIRHSPEGNRDDGA